MFWFAPVYFPSGPMPANLYNAAVDNRFPPTVPSRIGEEITLIKKRELFESMKLGIAATTSFSASISKMVPYSTALPSDFQKGSFNTPSTSSPIGELGSLNNFECPVCLKLLSTQDLASHLSTHPNLSVDTYLVPNGHEGKDFTFRCSMCSRRFEHCQQLRIHEALHITKKLSDATNVHRIGGFSIVSILGIQEEDLTMNEEEKKNRTTFHCSVCNKAMASVAELSYHLSTHKGETPFKCTQCNKSFTQAGTLKTHMRSHTGERPFKCTMCSYAAAHSSHLIQHKRVHSLEYPYKCSVCDYKTRQASSLNKHMKTHVGSLRCMICPYASDSVSSLNRHVKRNHKTQHVQG